MLLTTSSPERVHSTILTRFTLIPSVCPELFPGEGQSISGGIPGYGEKAGKCSSMTLLPMIGERFSKSLLDEKRITKIFFFRKSHFSGILLNH